MEDKLIIALSADIKELQDKLKQAQGELSKFAGNANNASQQVSNSFVKIGDSLKTLALGYVSLQAATNALGASFDRALKLDAINASMTAIMGSSELAGQQFQKLSEFANQYGLNLIAVSESYKNFSASATMANVPLEQTDYIFQSVAKAASVLKLSNEDLKGALNALSQMISKGTVQAEELRGQLGERLPGAFNLAAKSMGVTTQELGKMLERGEVMAGDLLPKLALELNNTFGDKIIGNVDNLQASINRLDNSFTLAVQKGNIGIFFKEIVDGANDAIKILESDSWSEFIGRITAFATGNEALKFKLDATTMALKQLNKEAEKTTNISELTKSFGDKKTTKATSRPTQELLTPMQGVSDSMKEAKELFALYKETPEILKLMGNAYASNPFFRDLINGEIDAQSKKIIEDLKEIKETKDTFGDNSIQLVSPEQLANIENVVTLLGSALTSAFDAALISGQNFGQVLIKAIGDLIKKLIAAVATAAILSVILNAFTGGGAAAVGGFSGILKGLTGFNLGGVAGSQRVFSGVPTRDNGNQSVSFEIRGDKLYGVLENYQSRLKGIS